MQGAVECNVVTHHICQHPARLEHSGGCRQVGVVVPPSPQEVTGDDDVRGGRLDGREAGGGGGRGAGEHAHLQGVMAEVDSAKAVAREALLGEHGRAREIKRGKPNETHAVNVGMLARLGSVSSHIQRCRMNAMDWTEE